MHIPVKLLPSTLLKVLRRVPEFKPGLVGCMVLIAVCITGCNGDSGVQTPQNTPDTAASSVQEFTQHIEKQSNTSAYPRRYKVKDGHITYIYKGLQEGSEEVYFTMWGMVEIKFTKTQRDNPFTGKKEQINMITLMRDSSIYAVDNLTKNARKLDNSLLYESAEESPSLDLNEVAESIYRSKGGSIVDTESIAGMPAQKWSISETNTREWRWEGIMLKTIVELPRNYVHVEAIAIDTLSPLPEGIFELPTDINIQDGISIKKWMEDLSKPIERRKVFDLTDPSKTYDKDGNYVPVDSLKVE